MNKIMLLSAILFSVLLYSCTTSSSSLSSGERTTIRGVSVVQQFSLLTFPLGGWGGAWLQ